MVEVLWGGTFNGGDGNDRVNDLFDGTFDGGPGDDVFRLRSGGTLIPEPVRASRR